MPTSVKKKENLNDYFPVADAGAWRQLREIDYAAYESALKTADCLGADASFVLSTITPKTQRGAMQVFNSLFKAGDFDTALSYSAKMCKQFPNLDQSPQLMEKRIVCMNKVKPPNLIEANILAKRMFEADSSNGEAAGVYGKALKLLAEKARTQNDTTIANQLMTQRAAVLLKGFERSGEFYPGINAAYALAELGNHDKAGQVAKWSALSAQASIDTRDWWARISAVEAAVIANDKDLLKSAMIKLADVEHVEAWMLTTTIQTLQSLDRNIYPLAKEVGAKIQAQSYLEYKGTQPPLHPMISKTYSYRNMGVNFSGGQHIDGNFKFGGQLPSHAVSSWDRTQFKQLLQLPFEQWLAPAVATQIRNTTGFDSLAQCKDPHIVLSALDTIVRSNYDTDGKQIREQRGIKEAGEGLERLDSKEHKIFDDYVTRTNTLWFGDDQRAADSRTSVALNFAIGVGDCRHHAASKQLLFDLWQEQQLVNIIQTGLSALNKADTKISENAIQQYEALANLRLRTADVEVSSYIAGDKPYVVLRSDNGTPLFSNEKRTIEEHTLNILVKTDVLGNVEKADLADSFYQTEYPLGSGALPTQQGFDFSVAQIHVQDNDIKQSVPVHLKPTAYAGERSKPQIDETGCEGLYNGVPTAVSPLDILRLRQDRGARIAFINDTNPYTNKFEEIQFSL